MAQASRVLVTPRYAFAEKPPALDGSEAPGGTLIDEQTGRKTVVVPPVPPGYKCGGGALAIGGPWIAFECWVPSQTGQPPVFRIELYRVATRQWDAVQEAVNGDVQAVGADWIEYWVSELNAPDQQFVFQNIYTGQTQTLPGWQPGGDMVPDLNSPSLGKSLCAPLRVPSTWFSNGEDWPGTVAFSGHYAIVAGLNRQLSPFGYLERCGTRMHRTIGPVGPMGNGYASANRHAVTWGAGGSSNLQGAYLPSLKRFTVDTMRLVNSVASPYTGQNTCLSWLGSQTLYVLVQPYYPTDCTPTPCPPLPSRLYVAPSPRQPHQRTHRR